MILFFAVAQHSYDDLFASRKFTALLYSVTCLDARLSKKKVVGLHANEEVLLQLSMM